MVKASVRRHGSGFLGHPQGLWYSQTTSPKVNPTGSYLSPGCRSVLFQNQVEETHQADALGGKCEQSLSATLRWAEGHLLNFTQTS